MASVAVGIDLGTTYSCIAVYLKNGIRIIENDLGHRTSPSMVSFTALQTLRGHAARQQMATNPENTIFDSKRLIGRKWDDPIVQRDLQYYPFRVVNVSGAPHVEVISKHEIKTFSPTDIGATILGYLKLCAEQRLGVPVEKAVITCPAYFNDEQRRATKEAGIIAGLDVIRILNEPTAAALAYHKRNHISNGNVLVFDLGGGTFDVSIVSITEDSNYAVLAVDGDDHLGGEDFTSRIVDYVLKHSKMDESSLNSKQKRRLRFACDAAKQELSSALEAYVDDPAVGEIRITRNEFNKSCSDLFYKTIRKVDDALRDAKMTRDQVNSIVLVGGSTRIPRVQELLQEAFGKDKLVKQFSLNADECVAEGAAILAASLCGERLGQWSLRETIRVRDVIPLSLGVGCIGGDMSVVIPRNTPTPVRMENLYRTVYDLQKSVVFKVYQGERPLAKDNLFLGQVSLYQLPASYAGLRLQCALAVDADGILSVEAKTEGRDWIGVRLERKNLSEDEIASKIREAQVNAERDAIESQRQKAKSNLEVLLRNFRPKTPAASCVVTSGLAWLEANTFLSKEEYELKLHEMEIDLLRTNVKVEWETSKVETDEP